jgi:hypothetical protein
MILKVLIFCLVLVYGSNQPIHLSEANPSIDDVKLNRSTKSLNPSTYGRLNQKDLSDRRRRYKEIDDALSQEKLLKKMERPRDDYLYFTY